MNSEQQIELAELDTRFESLKTRDSGVEDRLFCALERGEVLDPLLVAMENETPLLIDGFKRLRCLKKLKWSMVPCITIATSTTDGILEWLKLTGGKQASLYEVAGFVQELHKVHGMSPSAIADHLRRSKAWVCMRLQFLRSVPLSVRKALEKGEFPLHAWMYSVRPFMRVNGETRALAEEFVALAKKQRSTLREIDLLAHEWFQGGEEIRASIRRGNGAYLLAHLQAPVSSGEAMSSEEQQLFKHLMSLQDLIRKILHEARSCEKPRSKTFKAQAGVACKTLLGGWPALKQSLEKLHDQC